MATDRYWDRVAVAMHMDTSGFPDVKGNTVTVSGVTASTTSKFGGYAAYFNGSSYLTIGVTAAYTGDFHLGFWLYGGSAGTCIFSNTAYTYLYNNNLSINNTTVISSLGMTFSTAWSYIEIFRVGGVVFLYQGGALKGVGKYTGTATFTNLVFGRYAPGSNLYFTGYIDDVLLTSVARRAGGATLTVPTAAFAESLPPTYSGTTKDENNNFIARVVHLLRRSDGALAGTATSNATTGAFSIMALDESAHYAVCLDDNLDENALIYDNITLV